MPRPRLKLVKKPGATAMLVNGGSILLLKRISIPFIINPGMWFFVGGAIKHGERPIDAAYREIGEETGIMPAELEKVSSISATVSDIRKGLRWRNRLFLFRSRTRRVRLNFEHTTYRWVPLGELGKYPELAESVAGYGKLLDAPADHIHRKRGGNRRHKGGRKL
ncbi:MAG: NUDIX domain-containing protein [Candidatus Micrarchaeota archaeon]|nr:NUDIX domain-containing protein [Candidatus Micrarchaeota archaeon]